MHNPSILDNLMKIYNLKKGPTQKELIEMILQVMANNLQYREHVQTYIKQTGSKVGLLTLSCF